MSQTVAQRQGEDTEVEALELILRPYIASHHMWWSRLIEAQGIDGWVRVAAQHYHVMKLAPRLLDYAGSLANTRGPSLNAFRDWCREHAEEERPHHEWFASDLAFAGYSQSRLDSTIPDDEVVSLMGGQFALAAAIHPAAILGFFFAMECHPSDASAIVSMANELGVPRDGMRTIMFHVEEDLEHAVPIREMVREFAPDPVCFAGMCRSATMPFLQWGLLFRRYALEAQPPVPSLLVGL